MLDHRCLVRKLILRSPVCLTEPNASVPVSRLPELVQETKKDLAEHNLRSTIVGHVGDGNFHFGYLLDPNDPRERELAESLNQTLVARALRLGGTCTGEHGVGVEKLGSRCVQFSSAERAQMFGVKHAFDPAGLLNPGKVIPTLHRCAESGKMHVRKGLLPFPDLPRF